MVLALILLIFFSWGSGKKKYKHHFVCPFSIWNQYLLFSEELQRFALAWCSQCIFPKAILMCLQAAPCFNASLPVPHVQLEKQLWHRKGTKPDVEAWTESQKTGNMSENQIFQSQGLKGCAELASLGKTGPLKSSISETFSAQRGILLNAVNCLFAPPFWELVSTSRKKMHFLFSCLALNCKHRFSGLMTAVKSKMYCCKFKEFAC